jgi:hypothetical protein
MFFRPNSKAIADIQAYFLFTNSQPIKNPITATNKKGKPIPKKERNQSVWGSK